VSGDHTVRLEQVFQGPMDLLLHLVREQEVEIHEIEIARIVDGYLAHLQTVETTDLEYAGDFLVMAATLMAIKSRSLLPHEELDLAEELDPKDELIQRLIEYRRFRGASEDLERRWRERALRFPRAWRGELSGEEPERELELGELTTWDLFAVYSRLMRETLADRPHRIVTDRRPLRYYVEELVRMLRANPQLDLGGVIGGFEGLPPREALIGSFCALLELVRLELVDVRQERHAGAIAIEMRAEHAGDIEEVVRASCLDDPMHPLPEPDAPTELPSAAPPTATSGETAED
jgi:segregation and condensation protein A